HALFAVEPVFGEETFHQPQLAARADRAHQIGGAGGDGAALALVQPAGGDEVGNQLRLVGIKAGAKIVAGEVLIHWRVPKLRGSNPAGDREGRSPNFVSGRGLSV